jgi:hypothetical protein
MQVWTLVKMTWGPSRRQPCLLPCPQPQTSMLLILVELKLIVNHVVL